MPFCHPRVRVLQRAYDEDDMKAGVRKGHRLELAGGWEYFSEIRTPATQYSIIAGD